MFSDEINLFILSQKQKDMLYTVAMELTKVFNAKKVILNVGDMYFLFLNFLKDKKMIFHSFVIVRK